MNPKKRQISQETSPLPKRGVMEKVVSFHLADYHGWILPRYLDNGFSSALDSFLTRGMGHQEAIKIRRGSQVYQFSHKGCIFFLKRYPMSGIKASLQNLLGQNKAQKSWRIGRTMLARGLSTPLPVFYIHHKISFFKSEHIVGTLGIQKSISLKDFIEQSFKTDRQPPIQKRRFIEKLAAFLGQLHINGIYHGDFTARNILVEPMGAVQEANIFLIDLDAIRSTRWISFHRRVKNLDELGRNFLDLGVVGILDRARFLKHYLKINIKEKRGYRSLLEAVRKRTLYRLKRHGQQFSRTDLPHLDQPMNPKG